MEIHKTEKGVHSWKKGLLILLAIITVLRLGYVFFGDELEKEDYTLDEYEPSELVAVPCLNLEQVFTADQNRLNRLEVFFQKLEEGETGSVVLCLYSGESLLYQTSLSLSWNNTGTWKNVFINAPLQQGEAYRLTLTTAEMSSQIPKLMCDAESGNPAVRFGYLRPPAPIDKLVAASLWILLFMAVSLIIVRGDEIRNGFMRLSDELVSQIGETAALCGAELLTCAAILECSGIVFQPLTKILMYLISAAVCLRCKEKRQFTGKMAETPGKKAVLVFLYLYTAFAIVGQRTLIYPIGSRLTAENLLIDLCALAWAVPAVRSALYDFDRIGRMAFREEKRMKTGKLLLVLLLLLLLPAVYNLIANNPGISDVDTYESFEKYAQNLYGMYNWHPAFYSIVLHQIQQVWNSTYAVIMVQYFFWTYVMMELCFYLREKGMRDSLLIILALLFGINTANVLHLNTIWKDIPYAFSILWLLIILAKLTLDQEKYRKRWYIYLELFTALVFVHLFRKNGIVPYLVIGVSLVLVFRRNMKLIAVLLASLLFVFYVKGPVYQHYQVIEPGRRGIYIGLGQDILGAYYAGGEVSEKTMEMVTVMTNHNTAEFDYTPTWAHQSYDLDVEPMDFILSYLDTFLKNPILVIRTIIDREDCLWDVFRGQDSIIHYTNYTGTEDGDRRWNEFYNERVFRSIAPAMSAATAYTVEAQWLDTIIWRCGLLSLLSLTMLIYLLLRYGTSCFLMTLTPVLGQVLSLLLSTGWTDFRYFWPLNLLNLAWIFLAWAAADQNVKAEILHVQPVRK